MKERQIYHSMKRRAAYAETVAKRHEQQLAHTRAEQQRARDAVSQIESLLPAPNTAHTVADLIGGASLRAMLEPARLAALARVEELGSLLLEKGSETSRARTRAERMAEHRDTARRSAALEAERQALDDRPSPAKPRQI